MGAAKNRIQTELTMNISKLTVYLLIFFAFSQVDCVFAEKKVDYLNLGATLLKDGYVERAKSVLEKVDVTAIKFDFARYYTLKGIMLHRQSYPTLSNRFFNAAIDHGQKNKSILLYMAKNYWQLQNYKKVVTTLNSAGDVANADPQMLVIKAEALKQQHLLKDAWKVLDNGISRFPAFSLFYRQKFYYLLELGYYQQAGEYAKKYIKSKKYSEKDYLAVAYTLRENKQFASAAILLEQAKIKYPQNENLIELLGQVYIDQRQYLSAALVFDQASVQHPKFAYRAATLYLKAKQPIRSLQLNRRILNQAEKFKQRIGIDIHLDDYESLVAKVPALKRYNLVKEDNIAYAVGYGYFRVGDYANAKKYLKQITDSQLFAKAAQVFNQIEKCQNDPTLC